MMRDVLRWAGVRPQLLVRFEWRGPFWSYRVVLGVAIDRASEERVKERPVSKGHTMKIKPGKEAARA